MVEINAEEAQVLLQSEKWEYFNKSISIIFSKWTALQLASEGEESKITGLQELTLLYFKEDSVDKDHLEYNFYEWFLDECECEIEDGSLSQVALDLVDLFDEIMSGSLVSFKKLLIASPCNPCNDQDDDVDEEMTIAPNSALEISNNPNPKIVDEDGFELVQRRRK